MAEAQSYAEQNKARLKEITDKIESGIREVFESEKYIQYLQTMSRFPRYSVNNQMLIYMQRPDATHVCGYNRWRDQFGRNVLKGEKGIRIIAPTPYKKKIEQEKLDPNTKLPMTDASGNIIMEEKTIQVPMFKVVSVFDKAQTDGKPLPELAESIMGDVHNYDVFMEALRRSSPVPIEFEAMSSETDGYFSLNKQQIFIREGMSEIQTVSAAVHEIAHSKLHNSSSIGNKYELVELFEKPALFSNGRINSDNLPNGLYCYDLRGSDYDPGIPITLENHVAVNHAASVITAEPIEIPEQGFIRLGDDGLNFTGSKATIKEFYQAVLPKKSRTTRTAEEIQAESISYAVCAYYGIDTGKNSFGYLASWAVDKKLDELKASLETINKSASALISDIDRNYAAIMKERGLDIAPAETEIKHKPLSEMNVLEMVEHFMAQGMSDDQASELANSEWQARKMQEQGLEKEESKGVNASEHSAEPIKCDMPDSSMSIEAMNEYGYTDTAMLPLSKERAVELFDRDVSVYILYPDNTEAMAFDVNEIKGFNGIFGVEAADWYAVKDRFSLLPEYEAAFLENPSDSYAIYQLRDCDDTAALRFMNYEYLHQKGLDVEYDNYAAVYAGNLENAGAAQEMLDNLYQTFNVDHPDDFRGHSLSVSDIVVLKQHGEISAYYVDSIGFKEIQGFIEAQNHLKNAEMAVEDDYGMIDGIINNGAKEKPLSNGIAELLPDNRESSKKPSVKERLQRNNDISDKPKKTAPSKRNEMER